jgi:hypothetical protein
MKFVKFLLILILMGISFVFGTKFNEMKGKNGANVFNDGGREIANGVDIGNEPITIDVIDVEIKRDGEITDGIVEDVVLPDATTESIQDEMVILDNVNNANDVNNMENGTAVPESLQTNDIPVVDSTLK